MSLVIFAFIAPIPSSRAAEEVAILQTAYQNSLCPKIGPFYGEDSFEHDDVRMKVIVSGEVYMENEVYFAEYDEIFVTLNDKDQEVAREVYHVTRECPIIQLNEEKSRNTMKLADDYGEFQYYWWHGMKMIQYPGSLQQGIDYEHPDNYYYSPYYPELWNYAWYRLASPGYGMYHISQSYINEAMATCSFYRVALFMADAAIGLYALTVAVVTLLLKIIAAVTTLLLIYAVAFLIWLEYVLRAEQGDGWSYTYWNGWFLQASYGGWKDIWVISW